MCRTCTCGCSVMPACTHGKRLYSASTEAMFLIANNGRNVQPLPRLRLQHVAEEAAVIQHSAGVNDLRHEERTRGSASHRKCGPTRRLDGLPPRDCTFCCSGATLNVSDSVFFKLATVSSLLQRTLWSIPPLSWSGRRMSSTSGAADPDAPGSIAAVNECALCALARLLEATGRRVGKVSHSGGGPRCPPCPAGGLCKRAADDAPRTYFVPGRCRRTERARGEACAETRNFLKIDRNERLASQLYLFSSSGWCAMVAPTAACLGTSPSFRKLRNSTLELSSTYAEALPRRETARRHPVDHHLPPQNLEQAAEELVPVDSRGNQAPESPDAPGKPRADCYLPFHRAGAMRSAAAPPEARTHLRAPRCLQPAVKGLLPPSELSIRPGRPPRLSRPP